MTEAAPWRSSIACEGGPVIVAGIAEFLRWRGSEPLPNAERRELHLWSSFTSELPERFHPDGPNGHQFIPARDHAALEEMRDELFRFVSDKWPNTIVTKEHERWVARRQDGARLNVEFSPSSEFDRCIRDLSEIKVHNFDTDKRCLVWSAEPGTVELLRAASGSLVLAQVRYADDDEAAEAAVQAAFSEALTIERGAELSFAIEHTTVAIAWATVSARDCPPEVLTEQSLTAPGVVLDFPTDEAGALLGIAAGTYSVTIGEWSDDQTAAAWCCLKLRGPAQPGVADGPGPRLRSEPGR
jgi:hypothetical protein